LSGTAIQNVSDTAIGVAYYRAQETARRDALFRDPLAAELAGERGPVVAASMPAPAIGVQIIAIRTCIIDDFIREAIAGGVDTVLNLGAGLDTRPYRLKLPASLFWVEVDFPQMIDYKESKLAEQTPQCVVQRLKVDLSDDAARRQALAKVDAAGKKILVLTEGVITYLTEEQVGALADDLRKMRHACFWIAEYFSPEFLRMRQRKDIQETLKNAPFQFAPKDWFGFFLAHGWRKKEIRYIYEVAERLRRPLQLPFVTRLFLGIRSIFATAEARQRLRRFQGHILLEPNR